MSQQFVMGVTCPKCKAAPGKRCRSVIGRPRSYHNERLEVAAVLRNGPRTPDNEKGLCRCDCPDGPCEHVWNRPATVQGIGVDGEITLEEPTLMCTRCGMFRFDHDNFRVPTRDKLDNFQFEMNPLARWVITRPGTPPTAWSGSRWVKVTRRYLPIDVQICNFSSRDAAQAYVDGYREALKGGV